MRKCFVVTVKLVNMLYTRIKESSTASKWQFVQCDKLCYNCLYSNHNVTAIVHVILSSGELIEARALLESGSQYSFITK